MMTMAVLTATGSMRAEQVNETAAPVDSLKTVELQNVQVQSTRASKKTPIAFTDMDRSQIKTVNFGQSSKWSAPYTVARIAAKRPLCLTCTTSRRTEHRPPCNIPR